MNKISKMHLIVVLCYFFGAVAGASLFGIDVAAPVKVVKTGIGEMIQMQKPNSHQHAQPAFWNNPFSNDDKKGNKYFFNPAPNGVDEKIKVTQKPEKGNQLTQKISQMFDTRTPIKKDPYKNEKEPLNPDCNQNQNSFGRIPEVSSDGCNAVSSGNDAEYITETSEYETTTEETLNRIGGPPPAVVASLLG